MRRYLIVIALFAAGCATLAGRLQLDERYGTADPGRFDTPPAAHAGGPDYRSDVRPLLDARCVACHACYDAPCQLNLASYEGITRGANPAPVYSVARLVADQPTRLGFDALTPSAWRQKGFHPVLNEREQMPDANREGSVLYRMLALKQAYPGPERGPLHDPDLDFALDREQTCVKAESMDEYERRHPHRGMPFGLPALAPEEHAVLARWLEQGASFTPAPPLPADAQRAAVDWERFLNGDSTGEQLVARYIYEHWFAGQLHFPEAPGRYFQLVRSRTPPGEPLDLVATRRPYDDPGVARPYYRLRLLDSTPVAKTFMPLELTPARMSRLRDLFSLPPGKVVRLPGYEPETASNPFVAFRDLPVDARYRFFLDDARFYMMGFMKGPVCRGQVAVNVISDHFWVFFAAPDRPAPAEIAAMLERDAPNLRLPAEHESTMGLLAWGEYARAETRHMRIKQGMLARLASSQRPGLSLLWDGGGNPDAALTVFRHFDSASVVRGLAGERPQTALLIGYPLFERMHYLLLAGFDVYGNVGHQLASRLYMDFLRMEGELNFVALLPRDERQATIDYWYRGTSTHHEGYLADVRDLFPRESGVVYRDSDRLGELYRLLQRRYAALRPPALDWRGNPDLQPAEIATLRQLSTMRGAPASAMPELSLILVRRPGGATALVSLVRNSAHSNVAEMFDEDHRRLPGEDTLLALDGVAGAYPNLFFAVDAGKLPEFVAAVGALKGAEDLGGLVDRFGVRRSDPRFWSFSDEVHTAWRRHDPRDAAVLDYSRYEDL